MLITQRQTQAHTCTHTHTTVRICLAFIFNTHGQGKCLKSQKCIITARAKLRHHMRNICGKTAILMQKTNPLQKYTHNTQNGPVNMLDPIRKHFVYSQLWSLLPLCSQNWARWYMPDPNSRIRFSSVFTEKAWNMLCKPSWPDQGLAKHIWSGSKLV